MMTNTSTRWLDISLENTLTENGHVARGVCVTDRQEGQV